MTDKKRDLFKWTGIVAVLTLVSKVFGFLREAAIASYLGHSPEADAYFVALTIPALLFTAIIIAIKNSFIPVYGRLRDTDSGDKLFNTSVVGLTLLLVPITIAAVIFAPIIVRIAGPGFEGEVFTLSVSLTRILLPSVAIMGVVGLAGGFLNAHHNFVIPAIIAVPHDIIIIISVMFVGSLYGVKGLAWGTLIGYLSQFLIQIPAVIKQRVRLDAGINWRHPGLREMAYLLPPVIIATAAVELTIVIDRQFASFLPHGAIALLHYGSKIYQLPTGIITIALATVFYPTFIELAEAGKMKDLRKTMTRGAALIIFLMIPVTLGLIILGIPIIRAIFERYSFTAETTAGTYAALRFYSLGLAFIGIKEIVNRVFFSLKDTRTPMRIALVSLVLNVIFNAVFIGRFQHGGIALATSISHAISTFLAIYFLRRKIGRIDGKKLISSFMRASAAGIIMAVPLYYAYRIWAGVWAPYSFAGQVLQVGSLTVLGAVIYFAAAWLLRIEEVDYAIAVGRQFLNRFRKRS